MPATPASMDAAVSARESAHHAHPPPAPAPVPASPQQQLQARTASAAEPPAAQAPALAAHPQPCSEALSSASDGDVTQDRAAFYRDLHEFMASIGQPIQKLPTLGFKELDLWVLYREVTGRGGVEVVIAKKLWREIAEVLDLPSSCTDSGFRLRLHYTRYLEQYEHAHFSQRPAPSPTSLDGIPAPRPAKRPKKTKDPHRKIDQPRASANALLQPLDASLVSDERDPPSPTAITRSPSPRCLVDFNRLEVAALRKYRKHFSLKLRTNPSKKDLVDSVTDHFVANFQPLENETETLLEFIHTLARHNANHDR